MLTQTSAMLLDAYRDLNARKLFWITLILSALVVGGFAIVGVYSQGLSIAGYHLPVPDAPFWYKWIFDKVIIGFWLTWAATILALISTAGIFPDFIGGGAIDLYLAHPIGRLRLFITKYLGGLLFVTLQVLVLTAGCFVLMGLRGGAWMPEIFWCIPIVVCFFSYLFGICVLLGILTRSTIAALLLTILCWAIFAGLDWMEPPFLLFRNMDQAQARQYEQQAQLNRENLQQLQAKQKSSPEADDIRRDLESNEREAQRHQHSAKILSNVHAVLYGVKTVTPKTTDTIGLLDRVIFTREDQLRMSSGNDRENTNQTAMVGSARQTVQELQSRSVAWTIGTSLIFEGVMLSLAAWIFCRRDY